jgi:hypothetical protein
MKWRIARVMLVPIPNARMEIGIRLCASTERKSKVLSSLVKISHNNMASAVNFKNLQWYLPSEKQYTTVINSNKGT